MRANDCSGALRIDQHGSDAPRRASHIVFGVSVKIKYHQKWLVTGCLAVIGFLIAGSVTGIMGSVIAPLMGDLRWSNGQTSSLVAAFTIGNLLATPLVGMALDEWGARATMVMGAAGVALGLSLVSHVHSWFAIFVSFMLVGIGFCAASYLPSAVVVTGWLNNQKGLGMGVIMGAISAGAAVFSPVIGWWTELHGWRSSMNGVAALTALLVPLIWLAVRSKAKPHLAVVPASDDSHALRSVKRELLSIEFILAIASGVLASVGMLGIYYHIVPLLVVSGLSSRGASTAFGATWLLSGLGSLLIGVIADRRGAKSVLAGTLICSSIGTLVLLGARQSGVGMLCVGTFVLLWGSAANGFGQLIPGILAERFGVQNLGKLLGIQAGTAGITGALAPIATGLSYDRFGNYRFAIAISALATFAAFVLLSLLNVLGSMQGGLPSKDLDKSVDRSADADGLYLSTTTSAS